MGVGAIPLSEIATYIDLYDVCDKDMFIRLIKAMDDEYLKTLKEKETSNE